MRKVLLILGALFGVFVLAIVGFVALIFSATSGMPDTANAFFAAVRAGDMATARDHLSEQFKADTDSSELQQFLAGSALNNVIDTSWSDRKISNDTGEMTGSAETASGGVVPLTMHFVKQNDAWKIHSIIRSPAGVQTDGQPSTRLPDPE